mmetsp:Transcript_44359/g.79668  ORF Transcript_44359/g.79668 Transcript_44359/m.79668 type:complete len:81 (+) Transcript_44359:74-316(+)
MGAIRMLLLSFVATALALRPEHSSEHLEGVSAQDHGFFDKACKRASKHDKEGGTQFWKTACAKKKDEASCKTKAPNCEWK